MGLIEKLKTALLAKRVADRLKEAKMKGTLKTSIVAVAGAVLTGIVAQVSQVCPDLVSQLPSLIAAGVVAGVALWLKSPKE